MHRTPSIFLVWIALCFTLPAHAQTTDTGEESEASPTPEQTLDLLTAHWEDLPQGRASRIEHAQLEQLLAALRDAEPGSPLRLRAVLAVAPYAPTQQWRNLWGQEHETESPSPYAYRRAVHIGPATAWSILIAAEAVAPGVSVETLVAILGPPYRNFEDYEDGNGAITWYADSPMHVNPGLWIRFRDGIAVEVEPTWF